MTARTERLRIRQFGHAVIGEPPFVMSFPALAERPATSLAPAAGHDVQVPFLLPAK